MPFIRLMLALVLMSWTSSVVHAQDPPPPIGRFVVDVRGMLPRLPESDQLAESRGLTLAELPSGGFGLDLGAHVYAIRWKVVTFGFGAQLTLARAHASGVDSAGQAGGRAVTERFTHVAPQVSFNFGSGDGWSYLSGGAGPSVWSIVPDGSEAAAADKERLQTINYGFGARWFTKRHMAFHFDVRFYQVAGGTASGALPGSPFTRLMIMGAGVSLR
jgi:hypothetical protein